MQIKMVKKIHGLVKTIPLVVNDIHIRAEPDTGADVNVMDGYQYYRNAFYFCGFYRCVNSTESLTN